MGALYKVGGSLCKLRRGSVLRRVPTRPSADRTPPRRCPRCHSGMHARGRKICNEPDDHIKTHPGLGFSFRENRRGCEYQRFTSSPDWLTFVFRASRIGYLDWCHGPPRGLRYFPVCRVHPGIQLVKVVLRFISGDSWPGGSDPPVILCGHAALGDGRRGGGVGDFWKSV